MPIDITQFNEASKPLTERILGLLKAHPAQAYSLMEIMAALEGKEDTTSVAWLILIERMDGKNSETWNKYVNSVTELVNQKKVKEAVVQGTTYYAYEGGKS
ncbi:hypothetical protein [Archangium sp.]|uniref:hypothetical protein n=1 Tax=Archangium sp. TaxID=1872627 RepID=UPI00286D3507|nr:hypothetical protein [Archangium sp.]